VKQPAKTPLRYAADTAFHLLHAAKSAGEVEAKAHDPDARETARRVRNTAMALRRLMQAHEDALTR
jgi:hypothetical protein